ncbi:MAG: hypothetical protein WAO00_17190 [Chthoniobacterales bacterium]
MDNTGDQLRIFLSMLAVNAPTLLVCGLACVILVAKSEAGSRHISWAMLGFGLAVVLCFLLPLAQTFLQQWVFQSGERISRAWVFTVFGFVASILHAIIYGCLLAAVLARRQGSEGGG